MADDKKLDEFLKNNPDGLFFGMIVDIVREVTIKTLQNPTVLKAIALDILNKLPEPDPGKDGYTPVKGKDYFDGKDGETPSDAKLKKLIKPLIPAPKKGEPGKDAKITPDLIKGILAEVTASIQAEYPGGKEIVELINDLPIKPKQQIDASHIKNLPSAIDKRVGTKLGGIHRGGLKLVWNTKLSGTVNGSNTVFTVPAGQPDPKDDKFIISVRGVLKTADAGDFTTANNNREITFTNAPPNGSDSPRIILYHGK